jgi:hypothetical protein
MTREDLERAIEFLTTRAADQSARLDKLLLETERDKENIRALARIAEIRLGRLTRTEGGETETCVAPFTPV